MSFVDELERAIAESTAVCKAEDGVCHATHVGGGTIRFMAEYGPRLLAAVRVGIAHMGYIDSGGPECVKFYEARKAAEDAYRTACAGDSETGRLNKGE